MGSETAYLSLGSNVGDRFGHMRVALARLRAHPQIRLLRVSSFYETEPQGVSEQPSYLNTAAAISTELDPLSLLAALQEIEAGAGRDRAAEVRWGPRVLDLDVLLFGCCVMATEQLTIPHPRMLDRRFVLEPLVEIAPGLRMPGRDRLVAEWLGSVRGQRVRCLVEGG